MIVSNLVYKGKTKVNVYIDEELAFQLYSKDLKYHNIVLGEELSYDTYNSILKEVLLPRSKKKALNILQYMDRSEFELRKKLKDAFFPKEIIDITIDFVLGHDFLNDERYASNYIKYRKENKSWMFLKNKLQIKGIDDYILDKLYMQEYLESEQDPELIAIKKEVAKKAKNIDNLDYKEKNKIISSLYRKGFALEKIKQFL